jgi:hypothetical protein
MKRTVSRLVLVAATSLGSLSISGQRLAADVSYSPPVTWSGMTMLNVSYSNGQLSVVDQTTVVPLGIDTYNDPAVTSGTTGYGRLNETATTWGSFDPAQPWHVLNGTAFSRRLGWNSGTGLADIASTYGSDASIWIETESIAAGLKTYKAVGKFGVNANNTTTVDPAIGAYSEILSNVGDKWNWGNKMDHNTYTVDKARLALGQTYSATYKVYVGDATGNEIFNPGGSSTATHETWTWTAVSVPEPASLCLLAFAAGALLIRRLAIRPARQD